MDDETLKLRKEEQIYQQAMATYRHFHTFIVSGFLGIATIIGAGIVFRWIRKFPVPWTPPVILGAVVFLILAVLILAVLFLKVLIYTERSRMKALEVACEIEKSWFSSEEDEEKCLARKLKIEEEKRNPVWFLIGRLADKTE